MMYSILIVDDEQLTRDYLKENIPLIHPSWQVTHEAMDGQEALDLVESEKFDLIITDIKMPVMDGLALCKKLAEQFSNQRIIILSGYDEFKLAKEAIRYGVNEYLLKPIVKDELSAALRRVTADIDKSRNQELAYQTMKSLSHDLQNQFVKNFLKSIISDSNSEIKLLYPLIYRLKISLIESEGNLLILSIDDDAYIEKKLPLSDIPLFKFILNQMTKELIEDEQLGNVFYDLEENTVVLVNGENNDELLEKCKQIYHKVSSALHKSTGLTITGAIGSPVIDVLQLSASYANARQVLLNRLVSGGNFVYVHAKDPKLSHIVQELDKIISSMKSGLLDQNERIYFVAVKNFVDLIPTWTVAIFIRYSAHLLRNIAALDPRFSLDPALNQVMEFCLACHGNPDKADIISLLVDIIKSFARSLVVHEQTLDEHELVTKAKQYIYAHYSEPISLALIAEEIGVSPSYLSSIFHQSANESYIRFLTRVRMEEAAKLLQMKPPKKILDVAEQVGYVSVKHFSYVFKQHFQMPPGEYQLKGLKST